MVCSRLDISYAVSAVSRFMHNPNKDHWNAVKLILYYVKGSRDKGLVFDRSESTIVDAVSYVNRLCL